MHNGVGQGLNPKKWGPPAWEFLHSTASVMNTEQERRDFVAYIAVFAKIIPCQVCRKHFAENRQKFDIGNYMKDAESLLMWTYLIHDSVNYAQGKTGQNRPTWPEIRSRYFRTQDDDKNATPGSSEDYDPTICTEICGATVAKLSQASNNTDDGNETKPKILVRKRNQTTKRR